MSVDFIIFESPKSIFNEGSAGMDLNLQLNFNVLDVETAVTIDLNDITTIVDLELSDFLLTPQVESMKLSSVT